MSDQVPRYEIDGDPVDIEEMFELNPEISGELVERIRSMKPGESIVLSEETAEFPLRRVE